MPVQPWLGTEQRIENLLEILGDGENVTAREAKKALLASRGSINGAHPHAQPICARSHAAPFCRCFQCHPQAARPGEGPEAAGEAPQTGARLACAGGGPAPRPCSAAATAAAFA